MIPPGMFEHALRSLMAPIGPYLDDASVSEIMINGPDSIFIERQGKLERVPARFDSADHVLSALRNVAQFAGSFIDDAHPILEARLPDGSRIEAVISPIAEAGPTVAIRRFAKATLEWGDLVRLGSLTDDAVAALVAMTHAKCNTIVAGGTGSGKTSLLNVLAGVIPPGERVLVLEDTREISIRHEHVVYLTGRKPDEQGEFEVSIRDLFRASLRMRPDRIIVGELRGAEALDLVQATVSGHGGCLCTLHATYPFDTMTRLETMCMMSDVNMPLAAIRAQLASGIDVIVQVSRLQNGKRGVTHITEVTGRGDSRQPYMLRDLFVRRTDPAAGAPESRLLPTGELPSFLPRLDELGIRLPGAMFAAAKQKEAAQ
jgi:pilus assembly protein CpaF